MRPGGRGFSLIELLVVIVIVGVVMSIAILSVSLVGGDRALRDEAQRVISLVEVAQDIVDVLDADREPNVAICDTGRFPVLRR